MFLVCVSELLAWINILQDYTTCIFLGKCLRFFLSKIVCYSSVSNIIKFSEARHRERIW